MILETPKEKAFIWILTAIQFFLMPFYYYLFAKFYFQFDILSQKISANRVFIWKMMTKTIFFGRIYQNYIS
jgi:hypothetical protein